MTDAPIDLRTRRSNITSQGGENGLIAAILERIGVANRFAIEFGGFDARRLSNIFPLWSEQGFRAVLIEGDPRVHAKIARQIDELTASGGINGRAIVLNRWVRPAGPDSLDAILDSVPASLGAVPDEPDVLSIDIDSYDHDVWQGFSRRRPRVVLIEHNSSIPPNLNIVGSPGMMRVGSSAAALVELGRAKGYTLVACTATNCVFVREQDAGHFANAGDLLAHFDWSWVSCVVYALDGGVCFSGNPRAHYTLSRRQIDSFAPGAGLNPSPFTPDPLGWLLHPKRRFRQMIRRWRGR